MTELRYNVLVGIINFQQALTRRLHRQLKKREPTTVEIDQLTSRRLKTWARGNKSSWNELNSSIRESRYVIIGDTHTLSQSPRTLFRILREETFAWGLCLECFPSKYQPFLDLYCEDRLTDEELLERCDYSSSWGFPWEYYRPLVDLAKLNRYPVFAINSTSVDLSSREDHFADRIMSMRSKFREIRIYTLVGELHVLPLGERLPSTSVMINQNVERFFWKQIDVAKIGKRNFAIQNTPPWIVLLSKLDYYNNSTQEEDDEMDPIHQLQEYAMEISKLLHMAFPELDHIDVFGPESEWPTDLKPEDASIVEELLAGGVSAAIEGKIFTPNFTFNHLVECATYCFLLHCNWNKEALKILTLVYATSLLLNPKRITPTPNREYSTSIFTHKTFRPSIHIPASRYFGLKLATMIQQQIITPAEMGELFYLPPTSLAEIFPRIRKKK